MFVDISKAYLLALVVQPDIFMELPPEIRQEGKYCAAQGIPHMHGRKSTRND